MADHKGLPVKGYAPQTSSNVKTVNNNKELEERILRVVDLIQAQPDKYDPRWASIARTHLEQGFMALNRAVFKPARIALEGD